MSMQASDGTPTCGSVEAPDLPSREQVQRLVADLAASSGEFWSLFERHEQALPALTAYGLASWRRQEMDGAVEAFQAALALDPNAPHSWRNLAGAHEGAGQTALARRCILTSLRYGPDDSRSWVMLANLSNREGDQDEAEAAFRRALDIDPTLGDAHLGLGLLLFAQHRHDDAVASLLSATSTGYANALGFATLAHALYLSGRFTDAAAAFEDASRRAPLDRGGRRRYARARAFEIMIDADPNRAMAVYADLAGEDAERTDDVLRDGFSLLSAYGHREGAIAVGHLRLARDADDVVQRYLLDAVCGRTLPCAPLDYLERYFDGFAATFDQRLVGKLRYGVPAELTAMVARTGSRPGEILDLGCGTGLAAEHLATLAGRLIGIDVSGRMLDEAAKRNRYAELVKADALAFLALHVDCFDLVFAADSLIYFGDLHPLYERVAQSLRPGGLFAFSVETSTGDDYRILPSGRFAHAAPYLKSLAGRDFHIIDVRSSVIRMEAGRPVDGTLVVLRRRP